MTISPAINCGDYRIQFYDTAQQTLSSVPFSQDTLNTPASFTVNQQQDARTIKSYQIFFKVFLASYTSVTVDSKTVYSNVPALTVNI